MRQTFLSRSRIETYQACARKGYFNYSFAGIGLAQDPGAVYFDTGNAVHAGLAACLKFIQSGVQKPEPHHVAQVITSTIGDFDQHCETFNIDTLLPHVAHLELEYRKEQRDLSTAIVYAWIISQWQAFAERYEVLAIELDTHFHNAIGDLQINWESRADAIVRDRRTNQVCVISWKTAQDTKEWTRRRYRSDLQGFLECWFAEQHTGLKVDFNQVVYLTKGKKLRLDVDGNELKWNADINTIDRYTTETFLLGPLSRPQDAGEPFFNHLDGVFPNVIWNTNYQRPGNVSKSYFKGWTRPSRFTLTDLDDTDFPLLFNWIEALHTNHVFPTYDFLGGSPLPLDQVIVYETPSPRDHHLTEQLLKEISMQTDRYESPGLIGGSQDSPDALYSRNLRTCYDGPPDARGNSGCIYLDLCRGASQIIPTTELFSPREEPAPAGFVWRKPHHILELQTRTNL